MKVRILMSIAGNEDPLYDLPHFSFSPGDIVDLDDKLASAWIESGIAEEPPASRPALSLSARAEAAARTKAKAKADDDAATAAAESRKAAITELLAKYPQPEAVAQIEEARISGSPMHLVAARIAEQFKEGE